MGNETKAYELAKKMQDISIAEFFEKNRHLLGFDNKRKALLTAVKEAVDNSLDACEDARILPEINVEIIEMGEERFRVIIEDNGPGIIKSQIPKIFAKLLYGSKFHKLSQSRGQQGIGISAAVLYAQLTTGRPAKITSKISPKDPALYYELHIDTKNNKPEIVKESIVEWSKEQGTKVELDIEATYQKGFQSVDEYIKQTAIVNPHVTINYTTPKAEHMNFSRITENLPAQPKEIKPHPYGVELGMLIKMLDMSKASSLQSFLASDFSRIGNETAKEVCSNAALLPKMKPLEVSRQQAEKLLDGIKKTKIIAPPTDCISPIGEELIEKGLKKEVNAEFYCSISRPAAVYRGNPFVVEAGIAYGGDFPADKTVAILRFANRVPLLYQPGACVVTEAIADTNWKPYGLQQSGSALPVGPAVIIVHLASVWVPFTSEAKEAIAHYPEIMKEVKLALQECGRKLSLYINKKRRVKDELAKRGYIETYIPHIGLALKELIGLKEDEQKKVEELLAEVLEKQRGILEDVGFDPDANEEYDEDFALGKEEEMEEAEVEEKPGKEKPLKKQEKGE